MKNLPLVAILLLTSTSSLWGQSQSCPCCSEDYRAFDFWIGEWNVYDSSGSTLLGTSIISTQDGDCIIQEQWTSAQGNYSGRSLNLFDRTSQRWQQYWVDSQGNILRLSGGIVDGNMVMSSTTAAFDTIPETTNKLTWTPQEDGRVRQTWKSTQDSGDTWQTLFDGFYTKKEE